MTIYLGICWYSVCYTLYITEEYIKAIIFVVKLDL